MSSFFTSIPLSSPSLPPQSLPPIPRPSPLPPHTPHTPYTPHTPHTPHLSDIQRPVRPGCDGCPVDLPLLRHSRSPARRASENHHLHDKPGIIAVTTQRQNLSFFQKRFWKRPVKIRILVNSRLENQRIWRFVLNSTIIIVRENKRRRFKGRKRSWNCEVREKIKSW